MREQRVHARILDFISGYTVSEPLTTALRRYFRGNPQMGSRDRKQFSSSVFRFYRTGVALTNMEPVVRLAAGTFLCDPEPDELGKYIINAGLPGLEGNSLNDIHERIALVSERLPGFSIDNIFPFAPELSRGYSAKELGASLLRQPALFIRIRKGKSGAVLNELDTKRIWYRHVDNMPAALQLNNMSPVSSLDTYIKGFFEVQDLSSQKASLNVTIREHGLLWDACAASGGKSLALLDRFPDIRLFCSDIRRSVLLNLEERFRRAGHDNYVASLADLEHGPPLFPSPFEQGFDTVIADVPCTGSGTWARTPEMITTCDLSRIIEYSALQKRILKNILPFLKPGGLLCYITCSVFKKENEDNTAFIKDIGYELMSQHFINGASEQADSMYAAVFRKPAEAAGVQ